MTDADTVMTTEQLRALPDDDIERDLIRGELRERPMTRHGYRQTDLSTQIAFTLEL